MQYHACSCLPSINRPGVAFVKTQLESKEPVQADDESMRLTVCSFLKQTASLGASFQRKDPATMTLTDKAVLITGGTKGIGASTAVA
jgi:hypothetical protein